MRCPVIVPEEDAGFLTAAVEVLKTYEPRHDARHLAPRMDK